MDGVKAAASSLDSAVLDLHSALVVNAAKLHALLDERETLRVTGAKLSFQDSTAVLQHAKRISFSTRAPIFWQTNHELPLPYKFFAPEQTQMKRGILSHTPRTLIAHLSNSEPPEEDYDAPHAQAANVQATAKGPRPPPTKTQATNAAAMSSPSKRSASEPAS